MIRSLIKNTRAQVGDTLTWIGVTILIVFIMMIFLAGVGFFSSLACYYGIGMNYANFNELLGLQAIILVPFSMQYASNCMPKTIKR